MEHAFTELPLVLFTTLAPIGAGTFIVLALAFFTTQFTDEQLKRIDRLTLIPLAFLFVGFAASFFHLASPLHAPQVVAHLGTSPLSNEIAAGLVFFLVALVYCILALLQKLSKGARKGLSALLALGALVFSLFMGMAYMIETIPSWTTPYTVLEIIGFCLVGGSLLGMVVLAGAQALEEAKKTPFKIALGVILIVGILLAVGALLAHAAFVATLSNALVSGAEILAEVTPYLVVSLVGMAVAFVCACWALVKKSSLAVLCFGLLIAGGAIGIARLVFYAFQISVGL